MLRLILPFLSIFFVLQLTENDLKVEGFSTIPAPFSIRNQNKYLSTCASHSSPDVFQSANTFGMNSLLDSTVLNNERMVFNTKVCKNNKNFEFTDQYRNKKAQKRFEMKQYSGTTEVETADQSGMNARLKVGAFFSLWYILNIGYNIYNKRILNAVPLPWTIGAIQLWVGLLYFVPLWMSGLRKSPVLSMDNVKNLLPVAFMHTAAHITAVISLGAGAVSFTHIVKAGEPFFTSVLSAVLLKQYMPAPVYATLLPVVAGVGLASLKELSFSWLSFGTAMGSNTASALRGIFSKRLMGKPQGQNMNATNLYAVLTIMGALMLTPLAYIIEGNQWSAAIQTAISNPDITKKTLSIWALLSGLYYYTYNEVAFLTLDNVNPVTHAVGNTIKRVVIIIASVIVFKTSMSPLSIFGSSLAIGGVLLYSLAKDYYGKKK